MTQKPVGAVQFCLLPTSLRFTLAYFASVYWVRFELISFFDF